MSEQSKNLIYGIRSIIEAIRAGKEIEKLFLSKQAGGELFKELFSLARENNVPTQFVPNEKLNRITSKVHQGAIAYISEISYYNIEQIIPAIFEKGETPLILILDSITDIRNFGAIVRTAECAGVHAIVVPLKGAATINADAVKTSAGALNTMLICREKSLIQTITFLKHCGIQIIAATEKVEKAYYTVDFSLPTAIVMGSEDLGIHSSILENADYSVKIPLIGKIESLNVSVASGILLFEAIKQRQNL